MRASTVYVFMKLAISCCATETRGTQREYGSKPLKHGIAERTLVFKR